MLPLDNAYNSQYDVLQLFLVIITEQPLRSVHTERLRQKRYLDGQKMGMQPILPVNVTVTVTGSFGVNRPLPGLRPRLP